MTQSDFRSPLTTAKGLGSAHEGVHHWLHQRVSAVGLIFLGLWLVYSLSVHGNDSYANIVTWLSEPWTATMMFLFILTVTYHAVLGGQVIVEDYIHSSFWRYSSLVLLKMLLIGIPVLSLFFLLKIFIVHQA